MISIDNIYSNDYQAVSIHSDSSSFINNYDYKLSDKRAASTFSIIETTSSGNKIVLDIYLDFSTKNSSLNVFDYSPEMQVLLDEEPWIVSFLKKAPDLNDVKSLVPYYKEINKLIVGKKFDTCNCFFNYVRVNELSDVLLVGLLRLTYSWKHELPVWPLLLERSKKELSRRGHNSSTLLSGLN
ncbi:hypothetical protein [Methylobacter sp.]|uniref:hypothetical protein n=1 Tax=Methylobacter sp. TaxID=2051955 RepID=UPI003DA24AC0